MPIVTCSGNPHTDGTTLGTFLFFGLLTYLGAAFIWFYVPETSRLTLEEMDTIFGATGVVSADIARLEQVQREVGLATLANVQHNDSDGLAEGEHEKHAVSEKGA